MIRVFHQYVSAKGFLLIFLESLLIAAAVTCGAGLRFWDDYEYFINYTANWYFFYQCVAVVITIQLCLYFNDFYNPNANHGLSRKLICIGQSLGAGCLILGLIYLVFPGLLLGRGVLIVSVAVIFAFVTVSRLGLDRLWDFAAPRERILILGTQNLAQTVARQFTRRKDLSMSVVGFVGSALDPSSTPNAILGYPVVGAADQLEALVARYEVEKIVVALDDRRGALPIRDLVKLRVQGIQVEDAQTTMAALSGRVWLNTVKPSWFVFSTGFRRHRLDLAVKRIIDLSFACLGLICALPLMLVAAIAIKLDSRGAIIYRQSRVGHRGRCFDVLKFRSMGCDAEAHGAQWAAANDKRVTRIGRILRKYRIDELPQFINVIRGDMSFVGPRPERPVFVEQLRQQISYYDERHSVRPGLTGWAQVQYRYGSSVQDAYRKLEFDLFYLQNMSVLFDCAIVFKTVRTVLSGHGAEPAERNHEEVSTVQDTVLPAVADPLSFQL